MEENKIIQQEEELMHYGVKGQKWGVRRTPEQLGHKPVNSTKKLDDKNARVTSSLGKLSDKKESDISDSDRGCFNQDIHWVLTQNKPEDISSKNKDDVEETGNFLKTCWEYEIMEAEQERATGIPVTIGGMPYYEKVTNYYNNYVKKDPNAYAKSIIEEIEYFFHLSVDRHRHPAILMSPSSDCHTVCQNVFRQYHTLIVADIAQFMHIRTGHFRP